MRTWNLPIPLRPDSGVPLYLQVAEAVAAAVRAGRLGPGDPLPGARTLGESLGLSRNTVAAASQELVDQGWAEARRGGGTFIARDRPEGPGPRSGGPPPAPGYALRPAPGLPPAAGAAARDLLACATGVPDLRVLPMAALSQAYHRAMRAGGQAALREGDPQGHPKLRRALADMLRATRALPASAGTLMLTAGDQMALYLAAQVLVAPGDRVAVEAMGDPQIWGAFRHAGAELVPVAVDGEGLRVEDLEGLQGLRAVFTTPQRQYPTTVPLSDRRRARLLELARVRRFAVVEHDVDSEIQFSGALQLPLASDDPAGSVVHIGTLSKLFAPGVRLGFVHGPEPLVQRLVQQRRLLDRQGDQVLELAMASLIEDGEFQRHLHRLRRLCLERREAARAALTEAFGPDLAFDPPGGGMAFWLRPEGIDDGRWAREALARQVSISPSRLFSFEGRGLPGARLGFAAHGEGELREIARRLREAYRAA